ncbi:MAG: NADH-quinone oxidoreductase subunit H [Candidatus Magnetoovum sp. WYHC-5]|nr:NADH-quinone oxidoreductase subunit H [Candidatus Magnetoovum sp. WYHC-5]
MMDAAVRYVLMIVVALLMPGLINKVKALWGGRQGASILQPIYDICRLFHKSQVISETTSPIFRVAPSINLVASLCAGLVVPVAGKESLIYFNGDFVFFAYILALGRFFTVLGALDTGSSFEGMGASREVTFSALIEPAFFIIMGAMAMLTGYTSFSQIFSLIPGLLQNIKINDDGVSIAELIRLWAHSELLVAAVCGNIVFLIMILVEASRLPVDDPTTHLELTMIHEVMVLDNSGIDLAFIQWASALKIGMLGTLIVALILPAALYMWSAVMLYLFLMLLVAITIGSIESVMARLRMTHVPQFVLGASSIALIVLAILLLGHKQ